MKKRVVIFFVGFTFLYAGMIGIQVFLADRTDKVESTAEAPEGPTTHKVYLFSFTKYAPSGEKEIEIEGDSANLLAKTVKLMNVVAKATRKRRPSRSLRITAIMIRWPTKFIFRKMWSRPRKTARAF